MTKLEYPVTVEAFGKKYEEICGQKMPEQQKPFWDGFVGLIDNAYSAGVLTGVKKAHEAVCKA